MNGQDAVEHRSGMDAARENERRILDRLRDVPDCRPAPEAAPLDPGMVPLEAAGLLGQVGLARFLAIAEALARLLAAIHARGVIHRAIAPARILIQPAAADRIWLADFTQAATCAEERADSPPPHRLGGDPAYWSPEQTGRMNRPVDHRADLYALGLTLYALATGTPPFVDSDPLAMLHAHLARDPEPPQRRVPWLPDPPAALILRLLAKEPDDRYRSAAGLAHDLGRLRAADMQGLPLDTIPLGARDPPLSPRPPRRLHGRARELGLLMDQLAAAAQGAGRVLFVAGHAGVGKTVLIQELQRPVTLRGGRFASGKCDQFQHDRPFLAPARALGRLCQALLAESAASVAGWRERILADPGPDVAALFDLIPELEALLGAQPAPPLLGALESRNRRRALLLALIRRLAAPEQPLMLVLDDLQWADQPTLELLDAVLEDRACPGLLLIGAYRDHEVTPDHPLAGLLRRAAAAHDPPPVLTLNDLPPATLAALLADILHASELELQPLAARLHARTGGNPFFSFELLTALHRAGALRLDPEQCRWRWEEAALLNQPVTANLVALLANGLNELTDETVAALLAAACLGERLSLGELARAAGQPAPALAVTLAPALERGILITANALHLQSARPETGLRFCHDRMRQAVYQRHDDAARTGMHLAIARRLLATDDPQVQFAAAGQYALAVALLADPDERTRVRQLFGAAAERARRAGAFASAERFLRLAIALLPDDRWRQEPAAAFMLHAGLHLTLVTQARQTEADAVYARLAAQGDSPLRLVEPACAQIASLSSRMLYREAVALGQGLLARLGLTIPLRDLDRALQTLMADRTDIFRAPDRLDRASRALTRELDVFQRRIADGTLERLGAHTARADPRSVGIARLINSMLPAANFTQPLLVAWLPLRAGRLWIERGYCDAAIFPLVSAAPVLMAFRGDFAGADRLARRALELGAAREGRRETARGWFIYINYIGHWLHPLEESLEQARQAFGALVRAGDLEFAAFVGLAAQAARFDTGQRLDELESEVEAALAGARTAGNRHGEQGNLVYRQLVRALTGRTAGPGRFTDAEFDATAFVSGIDGLATRSRRATPSPFRTFLLRRVPMKYLFALARWTFAGDPWGNPVALAYFHIYRALTACLFDDAPALARHAATALALTPFISGNYPTALANLLHSLALIEQVRAAGPSGRPALLERLAVNRTWLAARAADAPMNFGHLHDLIEAERHDALGEHWAALQASERALRRAQAHRRPWHRAFIAERAGCLCMRQGLEQLGRPLLSQACRLYRDWGATGKVQAMHRQWPFVASAPPGDAVRSLADGLDRAALQRAAAALATETTRAGLMARVMALIAQVTGATDVRFLALDEEGQWSLEGGLRGTEPLGPLTLEAAAAQGLVPMRVLRLGCQLQQPVVSEDAVIDSRFAADPYFAGLPLCALLGLPVMVQGRVGAFLILEHRRLRAVFAPERVVDLLGGVASEVPLPQSPHLASFGGLVALHAVLDARNQTLRAARHEALEQARQALAEVRRERALRDRQGQVIDLIAHEYRTPLAILQTNLEILTLTQDPAYWRDSLRNMTLAIERLGEVFAGSRRRGDPEGGHAMRLEPVELTAWLRQRIAETQAGWPAPAPAVELQSAGPAVIRADPALLKTVLLNLLDNARKYGLPGTPIAVDLRIVTDRAMLSVGNDCRADPARDTAALLERAVRGANVQGIPGLGMGLYLVDRLVRDQGGQVELRRDPPERFEVRLCFPIDQTDQTDQTDPLELLERPSTERQNLR